PVGVLERFTLIGLDRRGTGTDALGCAPPAARSALVDADPLAADEADLNAQLEQARRIVQDCYLLQPGSLQTISTTAAAGDVEALRAALGVARLSAIGVGDGATALATWARGHAGAVGRLVLDGPPDPGATEPEATAARAAAAESAFDAFATSCTARPDCPLGSDPRAAVSALVEQLRGQPLVADDGRRLTAGKVVTALLTEVDEPRRWDVLAAALAAAGAGDPTGVLGLLDPLLGPGGRFDSRLAVSCNDSAARRLTPPEVAELAQRWRAEHPLFGVTLARGLLACSPWPVDVAPGGPGTVEGTPPVLVIGAAAGTRSTLEGSRAAAAAIENARFLSWQGTGAGAYPRTPCVGATVEAMLLDGVVPADGILCPP
ncbi:MAG TPA: alpha/beta hydrolase, partial [Pseudonocardia sp.]|nr:alpha/beta hydrolase [Pseudonocardia sp.]